VLAAALGEMELFKATKLGKTGLNAARLVQFLSYGGALAVLWFMAQRTAALLPSGDQRWNVLKSILLPLATLIVVASGQAVLLLVLGPLMRRSGSRHTTGWRLAPSSQPRCGWWRRCLP